MTFQGWLSKTDILSVWLFLLIPLPLTVGQFIWIPLYWWIIHDPISLVALQNPNAVLTNQITSFLICSIPLLGESFSIMSIMQLLTAAYSAFWNCLSIIGQKYYLQSTTDQLHVDLQMYIETYVYCKEYKFIKFLNCYLIAIKVYKKINMN